MFADESTKDRFVGVPCAVPELFAQSVSWRFAQRRRIGFMVVQ
jgi:hypothetical protein